MSHQNTLSLLAENSPMACTDPVIAHLRQKKINMSFQPTPALPPLQAPWTNSSCSRSPSSPQRNENCADYDQGDKSEQDGDIDLESVSEFDYVDESVASNQWEMAAAINQIREREPSSRRRRSRRHGNQSGSYYPRHEDKSLDRRRPSNKQPYRSKRSKSSDNHRISRPSNEHYRAYHRKPSPNSYHGNCYGRPNDRSRSRIDYCQTGTESRGRRSRSREREHDRQRRRHLSNHGNGDRESTAPRFRPKIKRENVPQSILTKKISVKLSVKHILELTKECRESGCHRRAFRTRKQQRTHLKRCHDKQLCFVCFQSFSTKGVEYVTHFIKTHAEGEEEKALCPVERCPLRFGVKGMHNHLAVAHLIPEERKEGRRR